MGTQWLHLSDGLAPWRVRNWARSKNTQGEFFLAGTRGMRNGFFFLTKIG